MDKKVVLTIAGSDPSGGAGIQADLKSFSFLGLHGTTVITCITSQNTQKVKKIQKIPIDIIGNQIDILFEDFEIHAVKTGMLYNKEIIEFISKKITEYEVSPVVDPVMISTTGSNLFQKNYIKSLKNNILPKTLLLTANIPEAGKLTGININSIEKMKTNCITLFSYGPKYVLVKGGHLKNQNSVDIYYDGNDFYELSLPRIPNKKAHGSGCSLSAIITGLLALGEKPLEAVRKAKFIIWDMINKGYNPGKGSDVLCHSEAISIPSSYINNDYYEVWFELKNAVEKLVSILPLTIIPEVGINFGYAIKNAKNLNEICAISGRIVNSKNSAIICGNIDFASSQHVSSIIFTTMSFNKNIRSALNIKYSKNIIESCDIAKLSIGTFDRRDEPLKINSTMEWGTKHVITKLGYVPDIIYDIGSNGKEPMVRIIGKTPEDVLNKLKKIIKFL